MSTAAPEPRAAIGRTSSAPSSSGAAAMARMNRASPPRIDAGKASSSGTGDSTATGETSSGSVGARSRKSRSTRRRLVDRPDGNRRGDDRPDGIERELELGDHAEVAAAAAQPPEQVGVLVGAGAHDATIGGHDRGRHQRVAAESVLPPEPAQAAAEREPGDARVRDDATGRREPVNLCGGVEVLPAGTGADGGAASLRVHRHGRHAPTGRSPARRRRRRGRRRCGHRPGSRRAGPPPGRARSPRPPRRSTRPARSRPDGGRSCRSRPGGRRRSAGSPGRIRRSAGMAGVVPRGRGDFHRVSSVGGHRGCVRRAASNNTDWSVRYDPTATSQCDI